VILLVENCLIFLRGGHYIFKLIKTSNYTSSKVRSQRRKSYKLKILNIFLYKSSLFIG
jgi:hypothetical protein